MREERLFLALVHNLARIQDELGNICHGKVANLANNF